MGFFEASSVLFCPVLRLKDSPSLLRLAVMLFVVFLAGLMWIHIKPDRTDPAVILSAGSYQLFAQVHDVTVKFQHLGKRVQFSFNAFFYIYPAFLD